MQNYYGVQSSIMGIPTHHTRQLIFDCFMQNYYGVQSSIRRIPTITWERFGGLGKGPPPWLKIGIGLGVVVLSV
jgi:hypothetical protein